MSGSPMNKLVTKRLSMPTMGFARRDFDSADINTCIDLLVYGLPIKIINKKALKPPSPKIFFVNEDDTTLLQWVSTNKKLKKETIELKTVTHISENPTSVKAKVFQKCDQNLMLSIQHGKNDELVLLFDDAGTKMDWWAGLQYFVEEAQNEEKNLEVTTNILIREMFLKADTDGTKTLDKGEVKELLKSLQIYMRNKEINQIFEKYDADKNKKIDMQEFEQFVIEMTRKLELLPLFRQYTAHYVEGEYQEPSMSLFELMKFFNVEQNQIINLETLRKLSASFEHISATKPCISFDFFGVIIFSSRNTLFNSNMSYIYQDMTKPLTDYYINTSHNTYLMSNQLTGESSVHAYINALKKGCRCVELDIWTGSNSTPIIYHGHTMTSKILCEDVIKALREHAFTVSTYPLILSFEMHCDINTQKNLVAILKRELGDLIYSVPEDYDTYDYYPSPEELQRKFIIKGKGKLMQKDAPEQEQNSGNFTGSDISVDKYDHITVGDDSLDSMGSISERLNSHRRASIWNRMVTVTAKSPKTKRRCSKSKKGEQCQCCLQDIDEFENSIEYEDITNADRTREKNISSRVLLLNSTAVYKVKKQHTEYDELTMMLRQTSQQSQYSNKMKNKPKLSSITSNPGDTWILNDKQADIETARGNGPTGITFKVTLDLGKVLDDHDSGGTAAPRRASVQAVLRASEMRSRPERQRQRVLTSPALPLNSGFKDAIRFRSVANMSTSPHSTKTNTKTTTLGQNDSKPTGMKTERKKPIMAGAGGMIGTYSYSIRGMIEATSADVKSVSRKNSKMKKKKSIKLNPELNALYGMIGKHMSLDDVYRKVWEISSVNENKIAKFYKLNHKEIVDFHKKFLSRIYPNASRIDSSNFDPVTSWASGSQLVALNFQKSDEFMLLNYAKFSNNGGLQSGYTLKPEYMCHDALINHEIIQYPNDFKKPVKKLSVKIISGQQIRPDDLVVREIIDPYIEVKIRGLDIDEERNTTYKTHMIKDNGFHPVWGGVNDSNSFDFQICAPDFAFLVITAYHGDVLRRDRMGWYAIELNSIQEGYRVVPLLNSIFQPIKGSYVLCKVTISNIY